MDTVKSPNEQVKAVVFLYAVLSNIKADISIPSEKEVL